LLIEAGILDRGPDDESAVRPRHEIARRSAHPAADDPVESRRAGQPKPKRLALHRANRRAGTRRDAADRARPAAGRQHDAASAELRPVGGPDAVHADVVAEQLRGGAQQAHAAPPARFEKRGVQQPRVHLVIARGVQPAG
jgi:hypothetical protein